MFLQNTGLSSNCVALQTRLFPSCSCKMRSYTWARQRMHMSNGSLSLPPAPPHYLCCTPPICQHQQHTDKMSKLVWEVLLRTYIQKVPGSDFSWDTDYPDWGLFSEGEGYSVLIGAIPPLPHMSSWHSAWLIKHGWLYRTLSSVPLGRYQDSISN
jgi:hypothetical protein